MAVAKKVSNLASILSVFKQRREEEESRELAGYNAQTAAGSISLEDSVSFWRTRQSRYQKDTTQYKEAEQQIQKILEAQRYQGIYDQIATGMTNSEAKAALEQWRSELEPYSERWNSLTDDINSFAKKIEQDEFTLAWNQQKNDFDAGVKSRNDNISFLREQLRSTLNEDTRNQITQYISDQESLVAQETEQAADDALEALHDGTLANEQAYLTGLREDLTQATASNDIVEMTRRRIQITEQQYFVQDLKDWTEINTAEIANAGGKLSDQALLDLYKKKRDSADPTRALRIAGQTGETGTTFYDDRISSFIPTMITNKQNELLTQFDQVSAAGNASPSEISKAADSVLQSVEKFRTNPDFVGYENELNKMVSNTKSSLMATEFNVLQSKFDTRDTGAVRTLGALDALEKKYPENFGELRNSVASFKSSIITKTADRLSTDVENALSSGGDVKSAVTKAADVFAQMKNNPALAGFTSDIVQAETSMSDSIVRSRISDIQNQYNTGKIDDVAALRSVQNLTDRFPLVSQSVLDTELADFQRTIAESNYNTFVNDINEKVSNRLARANVAQSILDTALGEGTITSGFYRDAVSKLENYKASLSDAALSGKIPKLDDYFQQFLPDTETGKLPDTSGLFVLPKFADLNLGSINGESVVDTAKTAYKNGNIQPTVDTSKKQSPSSKPTVKPTTQPVLPSTPAKSQPAQTASAVAKKVPQAQNAVVSKLTSSPIEKGSLAVGGLKLGDLKQQKQNIQAALAEARAAGQGKKVAKLKTALQNTNDALAKIRSK